MYIPSGRRPRPTFRPVCEQLEERSLLTLAVVYDNMVADHLREASAAPSQVQGLLGRLRADGSFNDLDYSGTTNDSANHYRVHGQRLKVLAQAYLWDNAGNPWFHVPAVRDAAVQGWTYLAAGAPGVDRVPNWWHRQIAVPNDLNAGLVLLRDQLPAATRLGVLDRYYARQQVWLIGPGDGANLTWRATAALTEGVLRDSATRVRDVLRVVTGDLFAYLGDGLMQDGSFRQHNLLVSSQWYSGGYGLSFAGSMTELLRWTRSSDFAFSKAAVDQFHSYVLDHLQWLARRDGFELSSQGREISRPGIAVGQSRRLRDVARELLPLGQRTEELQQLIARYENGPTDDNYLYGHQSYWTTDGLIHQRRGWTAGLRLLSNRTVRPETLNDENRDAFFSGDGFLTLMQDGDEYGTANGIQQIFPVWDWKKLPGTTVEQSPGRPPVVAHDIFGLLRLTGQGSFVGGATDGAYGLAAMDYRRATVAVSAHKAWFFFDDELVALGAGINAPDAANPVATTLNQVVLDGTVTVRDADDAEQTFGLGTTVPLTNPKWVYHDGRGYVFLGDNGNVTVRTQMQTGNWSDIGTYSGAVSLPVFTAWVDHGAQPRDAGYAYAVVANATPKSLAGYQAKLPVTVLANTADLQAVRHEGLAQTQAAFYAPGWLLANPWLGVGANQPVLLLLQETAEGLQLTVADPTHTLTEVQLDLTVALTGKGAEWLPDKGVTRVTISLPGGGYAGASVTQFFTYLGSAPGRGPGQDSRAAAVSAALLRQPVREQLSVEEKREPVELHRPAEQGISAVRTVAAAETSVPRRARPARSAVDQLFAGGWSGNSVQKDSRVPPATI